MSSLVLREDAEGVAVLTLNRPAKLNALSPELFLALRANVDALAADGERIRCVVVRGAGRSFCAGADLEALKAGVAMADPEFRSETIERLGRLRQPVIASVHGHCYTGGLELALAADLIIAAADTRFCDTHAKLGILPRWGLSARLPRRVGPAAAKRLSLTCAPVGAEEALRIGLCDYVVAAEGRDGFALGLAREIAGYASGATAGIKSLYDRSLQRTLPEALADERAFSKPPPPSAD